MLTEETWPDLVLGAVYPARPLAFGRAMRHPAASPLRVAFNIGEAAAMLGKGAAALRRECERKARREGDHLVADLALGIRAHKHGGRWFVTVPRTLLA